GKKHAMAGGQLGEGAALMSSLVTVAYDRSRRRRGEALRPLLLAFYCLPTTCLPMLLRYNRGNLQSGSSSFHLSKKKKLPLPPCGCDVHVNEAGTVGHHR